MIKWTLKRQAHFPRFALNCLQLLHRKYHQYIKSLTSNMHAFAPILFSCIQHSHHFWWINCYIYKTKMKKYTRMKGEKNGRWAGSRIKNAIIILSSFDWRSLQKHVNIHNNNDNNRMKEKRTCFSLNLNAPITLWNCSLIIIAGARWLFIAWTHFSNNNYNNNRIYSFIIHIFWASYKNMRARSHFECTTCEINRLKKAC